MIFMIFSMFMIFAYFYEIKLIFVIVEDFCEIKLPRDLSKMKDLEICYNSHRVSLKTAWNSASYGPSVWCHIFMIVLIYHIWFLFFEFCSVAYVLPSGPSKPPPHVETKVWKAGSRALESWTVIRLRRKTEKWLAPAPKYSFTKNGILKWS